MSTNPFPNAPQEPWTAESNGDPACELWRVSNGQVEYTAYSEASAQQLAAILNAAPWLALLVRAIENRFGFWKDSDNGLWMIQHCDAAEGITIGPSLYSPSPQTFAAVLAAVEEAEK